MPPKPANDARRDEPLPCPVCGRPALPPDGPQYPFCSERCKLVDLGRWLDGAYQIPVADDDLDESDVAADEPPAR